MEKLAQLRNAEEWDLIVVDTPPSRSALDFLDAPTRLTRFLDGRMARLLTAPGTSRPSLLSFMGSTAYIFTRAFHKILGGHLLTDVAQFAKSLESTLGGFRERADATYRTLQDEQTSFLVVAAPEAAAMREAVYFTRRLNEENMPLEGLILNRTTQPEAAHLSAARAEGAAARLEELDGDTAVAAVLRMHADQMQSARAQQRLAARFTAACPQVAQMWMPILAQDVYDLEALREFGAVAAAHQERPNSVLGATLVSIKATPQDVALIKYLWTPGREGRLWSREWWVIQTFDRRANGISTSINAVSCHLAENLE